MSLSPIKRRRRRVSTPERHPYQLSSNTFLRSERVKSKPRSIHTFKSQNRRIHAIKPQEITVKICQCFEGSNKVVHFSGKVLDLDSPQAQSRPRQQARQRRSCRPRPTVPQGGRREAPRPPPGPGPATATCSHISPAAPTNNGPIAGRSQQRHRRRELGLVFRTLRRPVRRLVRGSEGAGQGATHGRGRSEN